MAEQYANTAQSTLNGGITSDDLALAVANGASFPSSGSFRIKIEAEYILVGARSGNTLSSLTRHIENTSAAPHTDGVTVTHVITAASLTAGMDERVATHTGDTSAAHAASAIAFTPAGSIGATDVQAAIAEVAAEAATGQFVDVKEDYGAVGNGVADDTAAIQAAIDAQLGPVYFQPGTYITGPLLVQPGTRLIGAGGQAYYNATTTVPNVDLLSTLKLKAGSTDHLIQPDDGGTNLATTVTISDLAMDLNSIAKSAIYLVDQGESISRFWRLNNLYIHGSGASSGYAAYIGNGNTGVSMTECIFFAGTSGSRGGYNGVGWYGSDGHMIDCFIGYFANIGLELYGGSNDELFNMYGGGSFTCEYGIVVGGQGAHIVGASFDHNYASGAYVGFPVTFIGCFWSTNSRNGDGAAPDISIGNPIQVDLIANRCVGRAGETSNNPSYFYQAAAGAVVNDYATSVSAGHPFATGYSSYTIATTATDGHARIPSCAGAPTGVPAPVQAGAVPMIYDSTNNQLYIYDGGWIKTAALT